MCQRRCRCRPPHAWSEEATGLPVGPLALIPAARLSASRFTGVCQPSGAFTQSNKYGIEIIVFEFVVGLVDWDSGT